IERRRHKEKPPSVVFWLEHRMRKATGYLRDIKILDMSWQGTWVCDHEHTQWRQSSYSNQTRSQIRESMEPLHFKPMCLAIDCAKSGIVVKKQGRQRGIWNGMKTDNTAKSFKGYFGVRGIMVTHGEGLRSKSLESLIIAIFVGGTNISDQMWSCRCASDEAGVATMNLWYMGKSSGISATKKY
nr:hypothetical protein [Tanacetum cinerariifolium]